MAIRLGNKNHGIVINGAPFTRRQWTEADTANYVSERSGEYDSLEVMILNDPYVSGYKGGEEGETLANAKRKRPGNKYSRSWTKKEWTRLFEMGWKDGKDYAEAKAL